MAVTPGSNTKLNTIKGVSALLTITSAEETSLATKVLPGNVLVKKSNGKIYLTDGVATLDSVSVVVDQVLTEAEKAGLTAAYGTGAYVRTASGIVQHNAEGKIDDASLNVVADGKIVQSYLSDFIDEDGVIKVDVLPATARAGVKYVAHYSDIANLTTEEQKSLIYVIDATDDPSGLVAAGSAMYAYTDNVWTKIAEVESLDIDVDAIACNYANVEAAGGVMYDHTLLVEAPSATDLIALQEAAAA